MDLQETKLSFNLIIGLFFCLLCVGFTNAFNHQVLLELVSTTESIRSASGISLLHENVQAYLAVIYGSIKKENTYISNNI